MNESTIPLILLYTDSSKSIDGATRFQKLVFLAQNEGRVPEIYQYNPDKYGPYSWELESDLRSFVDRGLIEINTQHNSVGNPKHRYALTDGGYQYVQRIRDGYEDLFDELQEIKSRFNDRRLDDLLQYVYDKYPQYTTESELDLERLFDPEASSEFLKTDDERIGEYTHVEEVANELGEVSSSGESIEWISLKSINNSEINIQKFENGQRSVYWPSGLSFEDFIKRVNQDRNLSKDSECELRVNDRWIRGHLKEVLSNLETPQQCLFIAIVDDRGDYEVTWEKSTEPDNQNEMVVLFTPDGSDKRTIRSKLTNYLGPEISSKSGGDDMKAISVTDDDLRGSLWEISRYVNS